MLLYTHAYAYTCLVGPPPLEGQAAVKGDGLQLVADAGVQVPEVALAPLLSYDFWGCMSPIIMEHM
jgi:hypothetical protein